MLQSAIALAILLVSSSASAGIIWDNTDGTPQRKPQNEHESKSRILVQFFQDGTLVSEQTPCFNPCVVGTPGVPYNSFSTQLVGFDSNREELVSYSCGGGTDLSNAACLNSMVSVHLKVRVGSIIVRDYAYPTPGDPSIGFAPGIDIQRRYYFSEDHNFYWGTGPGDGTLRFPIGDFDIESPVAPVRQCKPVVRLATTPMHVNPLDQGQSPDVVVDYLPTLCQYTFTNDGDHDATITASSGGSCTLSGDNDECTIEVPFADDHVVFTSESMSSGFKAAITTDDESVCSTAWNWGHNVCSLARSQADRGADVIYLPEASTAKVTVTAGSNPPADRSVALGSTDNPVLQFTVTPSSNTSIGRMLLHGTGTGHHNPDLAGTHVYVDANNNGVHDAGDTAVVTGFFSNTNANGNYKGDATLQMSYALTAPTTFLVTVDINDELAAGASVPFAPWSLLLVAAVPVLVLYRRRRLAMGLAGVLLVVGVVYACGGGSTPNDDDDQHQADNDNADNDSTDDDDTDNDSGDDGPGPGPDEATLGFTIKGFSGQIQEGVPYVGATLTVHR